MGRPRKTGVSDPEGQPVAGAVNGQEGQPLENCGVKEPEITPRILEIMRLYPQYECIWINPRGFVHPMGAPKYLLKDAVLYQNKFHNK